ncbi:hypothetical protein [Kitasatospora sp. NPDC092286]|uniref:hypothetical protein n=1 Tax=Kitasatospora sp. NPDC092286 TaxID=3364087 RepID=UPI0038158319
MSRQHPGSRGQFGIRALVADRFCGPGESPHFIAGLVRVATPCAAAVEPRGNCPLPPSVMAGIVSPYEPRGRTGQDDKPAKHELGRADFQVRSGQAIQREPPHRVRPTLQRP